MRPRAQVAAVAAVVALLLAGCAGSTTVERTGAGSRAQVTATPLVAHPADDRASTAPVASGSQQAVVDATWALGLQALRAGGSTTDAVVSPSSLVSALAMLADGAVGDESAPFDAALGATGRTRSDLVNGLLAALQRYDGDPAAVKAATLPTTPVVHTASRLVVDDQVTPATTYLDALRRDFGAGVLVTDLGSAAGIASLAPWIRQNTGGLVQQSALKPDGSMQAAVQDAVVLAAAWRQPFDPADTSPRPFQVPGAGSQDVATMSAVLRIAVVTSAGWTAVRLPYTDDLSCDLYLPPASGALANDPTTADATTLSRLSVLLDAATPTSVTLTLPTLDLADQVDLLPLLGSWGITSVALTGIRADGGALTVSQAQQQAVLKVAEDGTRAAALTEIAVGVSGQVSPPDEVRFDRPFVLAVRDGRTGWPVFLASVLDPRH